MDRVEGKGIVVPEELLRAGAVVAEDAEGVCVYVDAEAGDEVAELARRFLGGNTVSGIHAGVAWHRPLASVPGLMEALVGSHDADIAMAREGQRAGQDKPAATPCCATEGPHWHGASYPAQQVTPGDGYTAYLEAELDRVAVSAVRAAAALYRVALRVDNADHADEIASAVDALMDEVVL